MKKLLLVLMLLTAPVWAEENISELQLNREEMLVKSANYQREMKNYDAAIKDIEELYAITKDEARYKTNLAGVTYEKGNKEEAYNLCKQAFEIKPSSRAAKCIARYFGDSNNVPMTQFYTQKALELDPNDDEARTALFKIEEYEKNKAIYDQQVQVERYNKTLRQQARRQAIGHSLMNFGNQMQQYYQQQLDRSYQQQPRNTNCTSFINGQYINTNCNSY
jgi:tetratricopeptide (TPR) repeat protein